jgi:hypothetical protein
MLPFLKDKPSRINVGFTGTQGGMSPMQYHSVRKLLSVLRLTIKEVHHGDCIGSDAHFHDLCTAYPIIIHPPINESKRAFCKGATRILPAKDYLSRNKDIVRETEVLIATPSGLTEELRSGTWSTIRFAVKLGKRVIIVLPDGRMVDGKEFLGGKA